MIKKYYRFKFIEDILIGKSRFDNKNCISHINLTSMSFEEGNINNSVEATIDCRGRDFDSIMTEVNKLENEYNIEMSLDDIYYLLFTQNYIPMEFIIEFMFNKKTDKDLFFNKLYKITNLSKSKSYTQDLKAIKKLFNEFPKNKITIERNFMDPDINKIFIDTIITRACKVDKYISKNFYEINDKDFFKKIFDNKEAFKNKKVNANVYDILNRFKNIRTGFDDCVALDNCIEYFSKYTENLDEFEMNKSSTFYSFINQSDFDNYDEFSFAKTAVGSSFGSLSEKGNYLINSLEMAKPGSKSFKAIIYQLFKRRCYTSISIVVPTYRRDKMYENMCKCFNELPKDFNIVKKVFSMNSQFGESLSEYMVKNSKQYPNLTKSINKEILNKSI